MSVRKLRETWWVDFRFGGVRYRKRSPINTRADAAVFEATLRQKLIRGEPLEAAPPRVIQAVAETFGEFAPRWMTMYASASNKRSTLRSKWSALNSHLIPYFGSKPLRDITEYEVERFKSHQLKQELSAKSINNELSVLRRCLKSALDWKLLDAEIRIRELRVSPQKYEHLSQEEAEALIAAAPEGVWREMIVCGLDTGMRIGEICALDWEDVDFLARTIIVRRSLVEGVVDSPKSNKTRIIPITARLYALLWDRRKKTGIVFPHPQGGYFPKSSWLWKTLHKTCVKAGIRKIGWHVLRHTFASELVRRGAAIRAVQLLLGHSTVQMTERYSHLAPSALLETVRLLEKSSPANQNGYFGQQAVNAMEVVHQKLRTNV